MSIRYDFSGNPLPLTKLIDEIDWAGVPFEVAFNSWVHHNRHMKWESKDGSERKLYRTDRPVWFHKEHVQSGNWFIEIKEEK